MTKAMPRKTSDAIPTSPTLIYTFRVALLTLKAMAQKAMTFGTASSFTTARIDGISHKSRSSPQRPYTVLEKRREQERTGEKHYSQYRSSPSSAVLGYHQAKTPRLLGPVPRRAIGQPRITTSAVIIVRFFTIRRTPPPLLLVPSPPQHNPQRGGGQFSVVGPEGHGSVCPFIAVHVATSHNEGSAQQACLTEEMDAQEDERRTRTTANGAFDV
ncbi:hypothetical protein BDD12DRAFT_803213 [Trichophaea hybrida]|nr:hypothetical protein BDD12DRAFT_803213 [Trichophaea hybrida]